MMFAALSAARGMKFAATLVAALALAGCASQNQNPNATGPGAATPGSQQDFVVNVGDRIYFANDSSELSGEARAILDRQATWLGRYPRYSILLEGHADERGTREYNIALGARRSAATRDYLISRGVAPTRLRTLSYGKERPVAVCDDESCWSQNRRAVTVLGGSS